MNFKFLWILQREKKKSNATGDLFLNPLACNFVKSKFFFYKNGMEQIIVIGKKKNGAEKK
jgi:hypothetical protein